MPGTGRERTPPAGLSLPLTEVKMVKNGGRRTAKERKSRGKGMKQKRKTEERERSGMYHEG